MQIIAKGPLLASLFLALVFGSGWFASTITYPTLHGTIQFKNTNRESDFTRPVCPDLLGEKQLHSLSESAFIEKPAVSEQRIDDVRITTCNPLITCSDAIFMRLLVPLSGSTSDRPREEKYSFFLGSKKDSGNNRGLPGSIEYCRCGVHCVALENVSSVYRGSFSTATIFGNVSEIDFCFDVDKRLCSHDEVHVWRTLNNFAGVGSGDALSVVNGQCRPTVSPNDHGITVFDHDKGCGRAPEAGSSREQKKAKTEREPRYISLGFTGVTQSGLFYNGFNQGLDLETIDVDVSPDGKIWFHAFGPKCLNHLSKYARLD